MALTVGAANGQKQTDDPFKGVRDADVPESCRTVTAYFLAEEQYRTGDYKAARATLDALWKQYPIGGQAWKHARETSPSWRKTNLFFGDPPAYYALLMLDECVRFRLQPPKQAVAPESLIFTVVLLGRSTGLQPQNEDEYSKGLGKSVTQTLDPKISAGNYRILHNELWLFTEYLQAITNGRLLLKIRMLPLADFTVKKRAFLNREGDVYNKGRHMEGFADGEGERLFRTIPLRVQLETDWWWVIHPLLMNGVPAFADIDAAQGVSASSRTAGRSSSSTTNTTFAKRPTSAVPVPTAITNAASTSPSGISTSFSTTSSGNIPISGWRSKATIGSTGSSGRRNSAGRSSRIITGNRCTNASSRSENRPCTSG